MTKEIISYKGFNADLTCRGFAFEIGKSYEQGGDIVACENGFHACEHPLDVFGYYPAAGSRFAVVRQSGAIARHADDSKIASAKIVIEAEIHLPELIQRAVDYVFSRTKKTGRKHTKKKAGSAANLGNRGAASATGYRGAASATGYRGAASATGDRGAASATGDRGAASATGYRGAASATGDSGAASATGDSGAASATGDSGAASATGYSGAASATGDRGAASATGDRGRVMGAEGCALFLVYRDPGSGKILHAWAGIAGRDGIKAMIWYTLNEHGKPEEVV